MKVPKAINPSRPCSNSYTRTVHYRFGKTRPARCRFKQCIAALFLLAASVISSAQDQACINWNHFSTLGFTDIDSSGSTTRNQFQLIGDLIYRPLKETEEYYWLGLELYGAESYLDGELSPDPIYTVPFAAKIDRAQGHILGYAFNAKLKFQDKSKLQGIYQALHIDQPYGDADPSNYLVENQDDLGTYETRYLVSGESTGKSRQRYTRIGVSELQSAAVAIEEVIIHQDLTTYSSDDCWRLSAAGTSDIDILTKGDMLNVRVQQQLDFERNSQPLPLDARILSLPLDPEDWQMLAEELIYPKPERSPENSGDDFLRRIATLDLANISSEQILQYLYDNEEYIPLLKTPLWAGSYENDFVKRLFLMIGKNDSPNSHWLLTEIYVDDSFTSEDRFRSLMALKYSEKPVSTDLIEQIFAYSLQTGLDENSADLSQSAMMVMGIIAKNQLDEDFGRYLSDRIGNELRGNSDPRKSAALLTALGNAGDPEQEYLVQSYLTNEDAILRERSAKALASMPSQGSLNSLSSQLSQENNSRVQTAMLKGMGSNELDSTRLNQVYSFAEGSQETAVRQAALEALVSQMDANPDVAAQLRMLLKKEKNKTNMMTILNALY